MVNRDAIRARLVAIVEDLRAAPATAEANAKACTDLAGRWAYQAGGLEASINAAVRQLDGVLEHLLPEPITRRKGPRK